MVKGLLKIRLFLFGLLDSNRFERLHKGLLIRPSDVELLDNSVAIDE